MISSINNKLILEPYKTDGSIKATGVSSGFATVKQKSTLIGLRVLADGYISQGQNKKLVRKGFMVFFEEEILHSHSWAKKTYDCEAIEGKFIVAEAGHAVMVTHEDN